MKKCELCRHLARMYCESDRASLCYDCDEKVHSANFLVAKHSRTLLCRKCQTPTPWTASGVKLGRAVSVCVSCVDNGSSHAKTHSSSVLENHGRKDDLEFDQDEDDGEYSESGGEEQEEVDEEDEDGENQVVPWSSSSPSPPPSASSSSSDEFSSSRFSSGGVSGLKRTREDAILDYENDTGCSSERVHGDTAETEIMNFRSSENNEGTSVRSFKPVKVIRSKRVREEKSKSSEEIINSLKRLRQGTIADDDN